MANTENKLLITQDKINEEQYKNKAELETANKTINELKYKVKMMEKEMNRKDLEIKDLNNKLKKQDAQITKLKYGEGEYKKYVRNA